MPIWSDILGELAAQQPPNFDSVRRRYLIALNQYTNRDTILYASGWLHREPSPVFASIVDEDIQAFMEVTHGLTGEQLDLILHSPGGSLEAAEAIVSYIRTKYSYVRVIVPMLALSAATMIACSSDELVLGKHSFLGPIDPQLVLQTSLGVRQVPAQAVLDQFDRAQQEVKDSTNLAAWLPMLSQYGPELLVECESAVEMSRDLVAVWLEAYMFKNESDKAERVKSIAKWLSDPSNFRSHSRHIPRAEVEKRGLKIIRLEDDESLQDLALSVFHATTHTFSGTGAVKIVENHMGRAYIKQQNLPLVPQT